MTYKRTKKAVRHFVCHILICNSNFQTFAATHQSFNEIIWLVPFLVSFKRGIFLNFLSQYSWLLSRKIDFGNNKVNYPEKFLSTRKDGKETPRGRGGGSVSFHGHNKKKTTNKQTNYKGYYRPLQVCAGKAFGEKALKCLSTADDVKLVAMALSKDVKPVHPLSFWS